MIDDDKLVFFNRFKHLLNREEQLLLVDILKKINSDNIPEEINRLPWAVASQLQNFISHNSGRHKKI